MQNKLIASILALSTSLSALSGEYNSHAIQTNVFKDLREGKTDNYYVNTNVDLIDLSRDVETGLSKFSLSTTTTFDFQKQEALANTVKATSRFEAMPGLSVRALYLRMDSLKSPASYSGLLSTAALSFAKEFTYGKHHIAVGVSTAGYVKGKDKKMFASPMLAYLYNYSRENFVSLGFTDKGVLHVSHTSSSNGFGAELKLLDTTQVVRGDSVDLAFNNELSMNYRINSHFSVGISTGIAMSVASDETIQAANEARTALSIQELLPLFPHAGISLTSNW